MPSFSGPDKLFTGTTTATITQVAQGSAASASGKPPKPPAGGGDKRPTGGAAAHSDASGSTSRPKAQPKPQSGGPPGDGGGDGSDSSEDGSRAPRGARPARVPRNIPQSDGLRRRKELDEIKIGSFPKSAADYPSWYDSLVTAVCSAALDEDDAFAWISRVDQDNCSFEELANAGADKSLDSKLRAALYRYTVGDFKEKFRDLCDVIASKSQELAKADEPRMIRGRQVLHIIKAFYAVRESKRITFELSNLVNYPWAGDAKLPSWKAHWDLMVRNMRFALTKEHLEEIYLPKIRQSDALKTMIEHYDRCDDGHADRCYDFLSAKTDKSVRETRQRKNQESLATGTPGNHKKPGAPALADGGDQIPALAGPKGNPKGGGKGDPKGNPKGTPKGGGAATTPAEGSDTKGKGKGKGDQPYIRPGFFFMFGLCRCGTDVPLGGSCTFGKHKPIPSKADREHHQFKKLELEQGAWDKSKVKLPAMPAKTPNVENTPPASPRGGAVH